MKITTISNQTNKSFMAALAELWAYRYLVLAFSKRDISVKYFQTMLGPLWLVLTPLITVGIMTFVFGLMVKIPSDGLPYLVFYLVAIVSWYAFTNLLNMTLSSLEGNLTLINKIYFPRLTLPASYAVNVVIDYGVGYVTCIIVCLLYGLNALGFAMIAPILLAIQLMWAMGIGLWLAPLNATYRDVKHVIPLFLQLYYFCNPILYPKSIAPAWISWMYDINPLAVCIATLRTVIAGNMPNMWTVTLALLLSMAVFISGVKHFEYHSSKTIDVL